MPLVAAAVCPHPPLLVPELAAGAAAELDDLRAACAAAVDRLLAAADRIVVVGAGPRTAAHTGQGSFAGYGVPLTVSLAEPGPPAEPDPPAAPDPPAGPRDAEQSLPLSLMIGAWLLRRAATPRGWRPAGVHWQAVATDAAAEACAALGRNLVAAPARVGLLVMGDGSACRGVRSPGYDDPRAEPFDQTVATALATVDAEALLSLDPALATELRVAGRAAWQVLAGAVRATGGQWRGAVGYDAAPYGVAYFVVFCEPRASAPNLRESGPRQSTFWEPE